MPKPRSYDDCVAALERGVRAAALQIVKAVFDAELARLEALLSGAEAAPIVESPARHARARSRVGSPAPISSRRQRRREPRADTDADSDIARTSAGSPMSPTTGDAEAPAVTSPLPNLPDDGSAHFEQAVVNDASSEPHVYPAAVEVAAAQALVQPGPGGGLELGTVKWFSDDKGYGFIAGDDGHDVFVHRSSLAASGLRTLRDGQRVLYVEEKGAKGPIATRVSAS
jgi:CspA family cold shock protein